MTSRRRRTAVEYFLRLVDNGNGTFSVEDVERLEQGRGGAPSRRVRGNRRQLRRVLRGQVVGIK